MLILIRRWVEDSIFIDFRLIISTTISENIWLYRRVIMHAFWLNVPDLRKLIIYITCTFNCHSRIIYSVSYQNASVAYYLPVVFWRFHSSAKHFFFKNLGGWFGYYVGEASATCVYQDNGIYANDNGCCSNYMKQGKVDVKDHGK